MATGDAAVTYDPLCGHGLIGAMDSARYAAVALIELARSKGCAPEYYAIGMTAGYQCYRNELRAYYGPESRWENSQFWSRRRADAPTEDQLAGPMRAAGHTLREVVEKPLANLERERS